jgi:TRAP-type uncharacterized transport system substrate-binding protein
MKLHHSLRKRWMLIYLPILLICGLLLWLSLTQWMPLPPKHITISAGLPGGAYSLLAMQYRKHLEAQGIVVSIHTTTQSHSLLEFTNDPDIDLALVNGILSSQATDGNLVAIAAIEREPIWIFSRSPSHTRLSDLRGLRIGVPENDDVHKSVTQLILKHAQIKASEVTLVTYSAEQLANALSDEQVDAVIWMGSSRHEVVRTILRGSGTQLIGIDQMGRLLQKEKSLRPFVLPQGTIEFRGNVPSRDLTMAAAHLHLLARSDMHPALQRAIYVAAERTHELPSFLQHQGEFPSVIGLDFPVSPTTLAASRGQRPWLEGLLPYRWAQWAQWLLYTAWPILLITAILLVWIPSLFDWRANAILQNFYGELKFLETEINSVASERPIQIRQMVTRLDEIEHQVMQLQLPLQHTDRWYTLRSHLSQARAKLLSLRAR